MDTLQETLSTALEDSFEPRKLVSIAVVPQLLEQGIRLSDAEEAQLENEVRGILFEASTLNLWNYRYPNLAAVGVANADDRLSAARGILTPVAGLVVADRTRNLLESLQQQNSSILRNERKEQQQLEQAVSEKWKEPIDLLTLLVALAKGARSLFDERFLSDGSHSGDMVFAVLAVLHARACQVSSEILVLLRSGFGDGAYARWRTLYELSAVSLFIGKNGQDVAVRYFLHRFTESSRLAQRYTGEPNQFLRERFENLASIRGSLVETYGEQFEEDYGWAAGVLPGRPKLFDIAKSVDLASSYSAYKVASMSVHASALNTFQLSVPEAPLGKANHANPCPIDVKSPGYRCAESLEEITTALLKSQPGLDDGATLKRGAIIRSLHKLASDVLKAFDRAEGNVETQTETNG